MRPVAPDGSIGPVLCKIAVNRRIDRTKARIGTPSQREWELHTIRPGRIPVFPLFTGSSNGHTMTFRFFRRMQIVPGLSLNFSKSGISLSVGPRGTKVTVGNRGVRKTVGLPGSGLNYTTHRSWRSRSRQDGKSIVKTPSPGEPPEREEALTLGFFERLVTPEGQEALVDGMKEVVKGNSRRALEHLTKAVHLADGAFLAGIVSLKLEDFDNALRYLNLASIQPRSLGRYFRKLGINPVISLPVTSEITAMVGPGRRGILLAKVEAYQHQGNWADAVGCLKQLYAMDKHDLIAKVSLSDLLVNEIGDHRSLKDVLKVSEGIENDSHTHGTLLLYRAKALRLLGVCQGAKEVLTPLLRRKKERSEDLLNAIRFERAMAYEELGEKRRARADLERVYAADPDFAGVAARLGI